MITKNKSIGDKTGPSNFFMWLLHLLQLTKHHQQNVELPWPLYMLVKLIPFDLGDYSCNLLLDDVRNCLPCSDEAFGQPHPERGVSSVLKRIKSDMLYHYSVCELFIHFGPPETKKLPRFFWLLRLQTTAEAHCD
ncbi:hypothetical protein BS78_10G021500 [Paspalum vaginatum]|nr:hypothetical protein BS78_10G021500 [Paspalum vaginatum]